MKKIGVVTAIAALAAAQVFAQGPTTITDTTAGSATLDGTINGGEYVGSSIGINSGFGDIIGSSGTLYIDSSSTLLNLGLHWTSGNGWNDKIVIYIDSVSGGFSDTSGFTDVGDPLRKAISGFDGSNRSTLTFAPGFQADYAIAFDTGFAGLWQLQNAASHTFVESANLTNPNTDQPELQITLSNLGINPGDSFRYVVTYLSDTAFRADEFQGVAQSTVTGGNIGQAPISLASGDFNTFQTVPEPGTLAFIGLGALGLVYRRIRAKKA